MNHALTPADIMDLRIWRAANRQSCAFTVARTDVPYIVCSPSDGTLYLNTERGTVASGVSPQALCALLINERLEPGYCARVCDPACTIEEALLDPASRAAAARRAAAGAAHARLAREDAEDRARESRALSARATARLPPPDYSAATLDDFL